MMTVQDHISAGGNLFHDDWLDFWYPAVFVISHDVVDVIADNLIVGTYFRIGEFVIGIGVQF